MKNPLKKHKTEYYFFSGKGGVGKTSVACATAVHFASQGKKTLIISTDPAHSLSDSFEQDIGGTIKEMKKNLFAVEIDPKQAMEEYKKEFMPKIEKLDFLQGFGLDDTMDMASMTPGIDEVAAFNKFVQYMNSDEYDRIIFDTAPTGHTLRLLSLPDVLDSWIGKIIKMRMKLSGITNMVKKILPFGEEQDIDALGMEKLEALKKSIKEAKEVLMSKKTHYNIVLIPEEMSILESERSLSALKSYNIPVHTIIVNQLVPDNKGCDFCQAKHSLQKKRLELIHKKFKKFKIVPVTVFKEEVKGFSMLEKMQKLLYK